MRAIVNIWKTEKKAYLTVDNVNISEIKFQEYYVDWNFVNFDNKVTFQNVKVVRHN